MIQRITKSIDGTTGSAAWEAPIAVSGQIAVVRQQVAIGELMARLREQQFPELDAYAVRILLSEALPVARDLTGPGEVVKLRYTLTSDCAKVRLEFCDAHGPTIPPWRLCRRRHRTFSQLTYLPVFSTAHRFEHPDGSLTIMRASRGTEWQTGERRQ